MSLDNKLLLLNIVNHESLQRMSILLCLQQVNPLSPNIHIQILQTDLHRFPSRISWENLLSDQSIFSLVIIS